MNRDLLELKASRMRPSLEVSISSAPPMGPSSLFGGAIILPSVTANTAGPFELLR